MTTIKQICEFLDQLAPTRLAEEWDNVGLLVGDEYLEASRIMACLTITPESAEEAISEKANLIVSHHPLPFRPIKKITVDQTPTKLLWNLIRNGIAIYSPHTGFDSAANGINQTICEITGLNHIKPLVPIADEKNELGAGRCGQLEKPEPVNSFIERLKQQFSLEQLRFVGKKTATVSYVASACGSGASFLEPAIKAGCDTLITGEADFHSCLEAAAKDVSLILLGHYASERFAIEMLSDRLSEEFPEVQIWPSKQESDPINWA